MRDGKRSSYVIGIGVYSGVGLAVKFLIVLEPVPKWAVNAVESGRPRRSKPLKDVATPRRFIYEALQKGGVIPHDGHEEDSYLMHPNELHV